MKKCPNGHEVNDNLNFCPKCGAELKQSGIKFCKKCGTARKSAEKFCSKCGTPFDGIPMTQPTSQPISSYDESETFTDFKKIIIPIVIGLIVLALIGGGWWYYNYFPKSKMSGRVIAKNDSVAQVDSTIVQEFVDEVDNVELIDTIVDFPDKYTATESFEEDRIEEYEVIDNTTSVRYSEREHEEIESYGREEDNKIFDKVEQMPSFPGGNNALLRYLNNNVCYPSEAVDNGLQGKVVVSFVVERDGSITEAKVVQSVAPSLDEEAVRVIKGMPRWQAGTQDGKPVRVKYNIPVSFRLQ